MKVARLPLGMTLEGLRLEATTTLGLRLEATALVRQIIFSSRVAVDSRGAEIP